MTFDDATPAAHAALTTLADATGGGALVLPTAAAALLAAAVGGSWLLRRVLGAREDAAGQRRDGLDPVEAAYLVAGADRAARTVALGLVLQFGGSKVQGSRDATVRFGRTHVAADVPPHLARYVPCAEFGSLPYARLLATVGAMLPATAQGLRDAGILRDQTRYWSLVAAQALCGAPALATATWGLATLSGNAQGLCLAATAASVVMIAVLTCTTDEATRPGRRLARLYRAQHAREAVSPLPGELLVGYALGGTDALKGTPAEGYGDQSWSTHAS